MPILLWLVGVPLSIVVLLMLFGVVSYVCPLTAAHTSFRVQRIAEPL
jgi:hypothetical protein